MKYVWETQLRWIVLLASILMLLAFLQGEAAHAADIVVGVGEKIPVKNGILDAKAKDVILLSAGGVYPGDIIVRTPDITFSKTGIGKDPVIYPTGVGSTFCLLQQAKNLTVRNIHFDCSGCDSQASHFAIRTEWGVTGTYIYDCMFTEPTTEKYAKNQSSRKQMNFDSVSISAEKTADVIINNVDFLNVKEAKPSIIEKADSDSTIVYVGVTTSATAETGVSP